MSMLGRKRVQAEVNGGGDGAAQAGEDGGVAPSHKRAKTEHQGNGGAVAAAAGGLNGGESKGVKKEPGVVIENVHEPVSGGATATAVKNEKKPNTEDIVCPYLDTISRKLLDFDFEKLCSVSLSNQNVYACLVCGKYYQGRGKNSYAYFHSLEFDHHVFINLETEKIYCLPDGYEVRDPSLEDITFNLHPKFTKQQLARMDNNAKYIHALDGTDYLPGVVGLNNIKRTDWLNVTVQALARVPPLRNFFILEDNWSHSPGAAKSLLVRRFSELLGKMCNWRRFTAHVSPHELLQAISTLSDKKFRIGQQSDPLKFLSYFLNTMHNTLKKKGTSIIHSCFQGEIKIISKTPVLSAEAKLKLSDKPVSAMELEAAKEEQQDEEVKYEEKLQHTPFLYLSLDLPPTPLFKDTQDRNIIPQIPLFHLLSKFDGQTEEVAADGTRKRYQITRLPQFLIVHVKRFQENNWFIEKNPTLVNFPIKSLDMRPYTECGFAPDADELNALSIHELKKRMADLRVNSDGCLEKKDLVDKLVEHYEHQNLRTKYDLLANICHEGKPQDGTYKVHIHHKPTDTWFEMQDLHVHTTETMPQLVALSEAYIQVYELKPPDAVVAPTHAPAPQQQQQPMQV